MVYQSQVRLLQKHFYRKLLKKISATSAGIAALELYDGLVTFPKRTDEQDDDIQGGGEQNDLATPGRVNSPRPGDKRGNTGERADKRKKLRQTLQTMTTARSSTALSEATGAINTGSNSSSTVAPGVDPSSLTPLEDDSLVNA